MLKNWKFSKVSRHYHCRGQQSVRRATDRKIWRVSKKSQISTEKITKRIMSVWKEKLQTVKIRIQNTLPAGLVHWHREHWKVQQRVQGPVSWKSQNAICETTNCWLWKVNLLTCFKGNKKKNDCQVWWLKSSLFLRHKGNCDTRKRAVKFRDFQELIEITTISQIALAKQRNIVAAKKFVIPSLCLELLKVANTVECFEDLFYGFEQKLTLKSAIYDHHNTKREGHYSRHFIGLLSLFFETNHRVC